MEQNVGLSVEISKRLLKKPGASVDAVLKVRLPRFLTTRMLLYASSSPGSYFMLLRPYLTPHDCWQSVASSEHRLLGQKEIHIHLG